MIDRLVIAKLTSIFFNLPYFYILLGVAFMRHLELFHGLHIIISTIPLLSLDCCLTDVNI